MPVSVWKELDRIEGQKEDTVVAIFREKFRKRRDLVMKLFSEIDGYSTVKPEGADSSILDNLELIIH